MSKTTKRKINRSATSGEFVTKEFAEANPSETTTEAVDKRLADVRELALIYVNNPSVDSNILIVMRQILEIIEN